MQFADIIIYDEEADKHQHIKFEEALKAAGLANAAGDALGGVIGSDATKLAKLPAWCANITDIIDANKNGVPLTGDNAEVCLVITRPFIEHLMMSAVMTVAGRDTGATLFGPADMQISANTSVKTIEGHYTCHTKSVITKEQNVLVMRDIMCSGYVAGCNTHFFGQGRDGGYTKQNIQDALNDRLSFVEDASGEYDSMLAFPSTKKMAAARDQVLSITDRLLPWEVTKNPVDQYKYFPGGPAVKAVYEDYYNLKSLHYGEDIRAAEAQEFISQGALNNSLCFVGPHRVHSPWSNTFFDLTPGQGHFGPDALPGDARWRRGESVSLESARNAMVGIEAAAHSQLVYGRGK